MAAGPLMLDLNGLELTLEEQDLLVHPMTGGVIFFSRNFASKNQLIELAGQIRELRPELLLAVDQEGGRVQRFREGFTAIPAMQVFGGCLMKTPELAETLIPDVGWLMAAEILASGLDFSFAPVLDVDDLFCEVIGDRSFSDNPDIVTGTARLFIEGMHEAGMAVTGKHFPGHGGVRADSHLQTPYDQRSLDELRLRDLQPFICLSSQLDAIMPAHIVFSSVDNQCVGFSGLWLQQILRRELAFDGVIFSDDLSMRGADIAGGYPEKARLALEAGCDMVLVCNNRAGALEVLTWLEQTRIEPSVRLPGMRARQSHRWTDLLNSDRRRQTITRIDALLKGSQLC